MFWTPVVSVFLLSEFNCKITSGKYRLQVKQEGSGQSTTFKGMGRDKLVRTS